MRELRMVATSDTHLDDRIWASRPIHGDSYHAWDQIVTYAVDNSIRVLVLAGDILNVQTNPSTPILRLSDGIRRLERHGIHVLFVQGQHDYQRNPWLSAYPGAVHLHDTSHTVEGFRFYGHDFDSRDVLLEALCKQTQPIDFFVSHQVWHDLMGDIATWQLRSEDLPASVRNVISGDYHVHTAFDLPGGGRFFSPGSTHMRSINEPVDKFFYEILLREGSSPEVTSVPLRTRRCFTIDLLSFESVEDVFAAADTAISNAAAYVEMHSLPEDVATPIIVIRYDDSTVRALRSLVRHVAGRAHCFYSTVSTEAGKPLEVSEERIANVRIGLVEALPLVLDAETQPQEFRLASELLSGDGNKKQILDDWFQRTGDIG